MRRVTSPSGRPEWERRVAEGTRYLRLTHLHERSDGAGFIECYWGLHGTAIKDGYVGDFDLRGCGSTEHVLTVVRVWLVELCGDKEVPPTDWTMLD